MQESLKTLVLTLEDDLRQRVDAVPELANTVAEEYRRAKAAHRTAESLAEFREQRVTEAAVAWVLAAVFVRFLEDAGFLDEPVASGGEGGRVRWISGDRLALVDLATDRERAYFRDEPRHGERQYLLHVFERMAALPGLGALFHREQTPLWRLAPSADGARALIDLFRRRDAESGAVELTFSGGPDPVTGLHDTRFLGDLYQDLSEATRKRYALLQTPDFVESFMLDRALTPAMERWGFETVRLIDPACGSGHFLLGAFARLLEKHRHATPEDPARALAQRALDQVTGVDLNPFAAAIARFRLLIAALDACGIQRLAAAPDFRVRVAAGDSLLHGRRHSRLRSGDLFTFDEEETEYQHFFATEDQELIASIFAQRYHVVVANPPYITVKDPGPRGLYKKRFDSCYRQYSLVCPFVERTFDLTKADGFVAIIAGNAFMKREFGKKLVEDVLLDWDLTHVVDTSGAYIPGHGTPTVILLGQGRKPTAPTVRTVMGIRGEPVTPEDPAKGRVWSAIIDQIDRPGSESEWVSVEDVPRNRLKKHPWSLQGGGASEIKAALESAAATTLENSTDAIGFVCMTRADDLFFTPSHALRNAGIAPKNIIENVEGDRVREWAIVAPNTTLFPYDSDLRPVDEDMDSPVIRFAWPHRTHLWLRREPNGNHREIGLTWYEWSRFQRKRFQTPLSITFAFVATHNHFVLDRGGKVFKQTAPVIKLPADATEDDHLALLGPLNSSTGCFWMKQMFFCRGSTVDKRGARQTTVPFEDFWEHDGTKLKQFPLPAERPTNLARRLDALGQRLLESTPSALCAREVPTRASLDAARAEWTSIRRRMIAWQEELDWRCYGLYGLLDDPPTVAEGVEPPELELGQRAFEIALARRVAAGEVETTWFERHGSTPITDPPDHWPADHRRCVERRLQAMADHKAIRMIERPEFKRRWSHTPWETLEQDALRAWLLDRLEASNLWSEPRLLSTAQLTDLLRRDSHFEAVAALYRGHGDFDRTRLVTELVQSEAVPHLAHQRHKPAGLRKRAVWESVWDLQRHEDALDHRAALDPGDPDHLTAQQLADAKATLDIPVPPKYGRADFRAATTWRLRGKLDVPKERFVLYPEAERPNDPTPMVGWAGWTTLDRAKAVATRYVDARDQEAAASGVLSTLLDGLDELLPWLLQWHNDHDPTVGMGMGTYFQDFLGEERRRLARREVE